MLPLNRQLEQLNFQLSEVGKTAEVTKQVKAYLRDFLSDFSALRLTENLDNADLRRVIDKIEVMSKDEIYVYFKSNTVTTFSLPIRLSDTVKIDTNTSHSICGGVVSGVFRDAPGTCADSVGLYDTASCAVQRRLLDRNRSMCRCSRSESSGLGSGSFRRRPASCPPNRLYRQSSAGFSARPS